MCCVANTCSGSMRWHHNTRAGKAPGCPAPPPPEAPHEAIGTRHQRVLRSPGTANTTPREAQSMAFRPLHDLVLVRRIEQSAKTAGGIIIPDTAKEKPMEGEIVAVGPGARGEDGTLHPLDVKKGDRILFGKWSGTEIKIDGTDLLIMKESDIMGIIEGAVSMKKAA